MGAPGVNGNLALALGKAALVFLGRWVTGPAKLDELRGIVCNMRRQEDAAHGILKAGLEKLDSRLDSLEKKIEALKGFVEGYVKAREG